MFARISTRVGSRDKIDEAIGLAKEHLEEGLPNARRRFPGFKGVFLLFDRGSGKTVAITLWESEEEMERKEREDKKEEETGLPPAGLASAGFETASVERFEVALHELI